MEAMLNILERDVHDEYRHKVKELLKDKGNARKYTALHVAAMESALRVAR